MNERHAHTWSVGRIAEMGARQGVESVLDLR